MTAVSFEHVKIQESHDELVDLANYSFVLEPVYFLQGLSLTKKMFLRKSVVEKLLEIQKKLKVYTFKIWDGYRSREVQNNIYQKYWNKLKKAHPQWSEKKLQDEVSVFVTLPTDPNRIPPHATGGAVDLTLVDHNNKELEMGTVFDHFGPEAAPFYFEKNKINNTVERNRKLLREAMVHSGFRYDKDEWWHFDYGNQLWAAYYNRFSAMFGEVSNAGDT